jgi:predicted nucleic acid-binding protein
LPRRNHVIGKAANSHSIFVDSSAWIALFSRRDQHHEEADRLFRTMVSAKQRMLTTNLVLAEIHRLLLHRAGIKAAVTALEKIEASALVDIEFADPTHHQSAMVWIGKLREHPISYADAVSFSIMETTGCSEVLSYDHHFQIAGYKTL